MAQHRIIAALDRAPLEGCRRRHFGSAGDAGYRAQLFLRHKIGIVEIDADHPHVGLGKAAGIKRAEQRLEGLVDLHVGAGMGNADQLDRPDLAYGNV